MLPQSTYLQRFATHCPCPPLVLACKFSVFLSHVFRLFRDYTAIYGSKYIMADAAPAAAEGAAAAAPAAAAPAAAEGAAAAAPAAAAPAAPAAAAEAVAAPAAPAAAAEAAAAPAAPADDTQPRCTLCWEPLSVGARFALSCGHVYHHQCIHDYAEHQRYEAAQRLRRPPLPAPLALEELKCPVCKQTARQLMQQVVCFPWCVTFLRAFRIPNLAGVSAFRILRAFPHSSLCAARASM